MSVTDEYLRNNAAFAEQFGGPLPLPPAKHVAVVACMDARLNVYGILGLKEGEAHVRQSIARIKASPFIPHREVRGFVFDIATGKLNEVS